MSNPQPDLDYTATATLLATAYQLAGGPRARRHDVMLRFADLVNQTTEMAPVLQAATWTVDDTKFPQTVVGVLREIENNCLHYVDDDVDAKARKVFAGFDPVSRAALAEAQRIIDSGGDRKVRISFGWAFGKNQHGEGAMRRLYRVVPVAARAQGGQGRPELNGDPTSPPPAPQTPPPAAQEARQTPPPARQAPEAPLQPAPAPAAPAASLCPDASDALVQLHEYAVTIRRDGLEASGLAEGHYQLLRQGLEELDRPDRVHLSKSMNLNEGIRDITKPANAGQYARIIEALVALACGAAA